MDKYECYDIMDFVDESEFENREATSQYLRTNPTDDELVELTKPIKDEKIQGIRKHLLYMRKKLSDKQRWCLAKALIVRDWVGCSGADEGDGPDW